MDTAPITVLCPNPASRALFRVGWDRVPFEFSHALYASELFSLPALIDLARRVAPRSNRSYVEEDHTAPGNGWSDRPSKKSLVENLEEIADTHSLVMLKRVHEEPEYRCVLDACTDELSQLSGIDMRRSYRDALMTILITSPGRITPYHIDSEANLLMQMHGSKSVFIFDGNDREVLPAVELERFWSGDIKAATYREQLQERAWRFELSPGVGVCNPIIFPHWVQNGQNVSVSLSINYKRVADQSADVFRMNARLRKIGLHPSEPGHRPMRDGTKAGLYRTIRNVNHVLHPRKTHHA
ncbi:hypothetical protein [Paracidobacterium acidisoli]|uniref:JmjC domain-containing protein n=1 Tax=Paracidobacterium acidisoli TaxID=2303751 RepID=A0A372IJY0_9BACT|nr:hypothetical protein [Paracidobacterium acidisoli]MBT9332601.1 hypothetical protein [Paracidobacterium acidisoli]